jgi:hypothetical protein
MTARRDTSADDMSWMLRLTNQGLDTDKMFRALTAKPSGKRDPGSLKYLRILETRGLDAADAYARRTIQAAQDFVEANPAIRDRNAALVRLLEIESAAAALPWGVYAGPGVRRALEAAFVVADRVGSVAFGLALREWAEIAGQDFETIRTNRNVLTALGWLLRNPNDRPGRTSRFTIRRPSHIQHTGGMNVEIADDRRWLTHDAFRPTALQDSGWYALQKIARPISRNELEIATGFGTETLDDHLRRLERFDLIYVTDDLILRIPEDPVPLLDRAARHFDTAGEAERVRQRHRKEQHDWHDRVQDVNVAVGA